MNVSIVGLLRVQIILLFSRSVDVHIELIFELNEEESSCRH